MLGLQRVTKDLNGSSFDCGNARIQEQIQDSYLATLLREGYAYEITFKKEHAERKEVLGYCMVKLVTLRESQLPPEELDYYSTVYAGRPMEYAAVELTYLAIDKDLQGLGLGTAVLKLLIHRVMEVSDVIPIRYLVLNALKAKVSFYLRAGFQPLGEGETGTQFMYLDCLRNRQALEDYLEEYQ